MTGESVTPNPHRFGITFVCRCCSKADMNSKVLSCFIYLLVQHIHAVLYTHRDVAIGSWCRSETATVDLYHSYNYTLSQSPPNSQAVASCDWSLRLPGVRSLEARLSSLQLPFTTVIVSSFMMGTKRNVTGCLQVYAGPCASTSCQTVTCLTELSLWKKITSNEICFRYRRAGATLGLNINQRLSFNLIIKITSKLCSDNSETVRRQGHQTIGDGRGGVCEVICTTDGQRYNTCTEKIPIGITPLAISTSGQHKTKTTKKPTTSKVVNPSKAIEAPNRPTTTKIEQRTPADLTSNLPTGYITVRPTHVSTTSVIYDFFRPVRSTILNIVTKSPKFPSKSTDRWEPLGSMFTPDHSKPDINTKTMSEKSTPPLVQSIISMSYSKTYSSREKPVTLPDSTISTAPYPMSTLTSSLKRIHDSSADDVTTTGSSVSIHEHKSTTISMRSSSSAGSDLGRTEVILIVGVVSGMAGILLVALTITCLCCFTQLRKRGRLHSCDAHSTLSLDTSLFRMNEYWRHNWLVHQRNVLHPGTIRTTNQESVLPSQLADDVSYLYRQVRCPKPKRSSKVNSSMSYSEATQHQNEKDEQVYDNIQNAIRRLGSSMAISSAGSSLKKGNNSTAMNGDNHQQCPRKGQANKYVGDMMVSCPTKHPMDSIVGDTDVDEDVFFEQRL